MCFVMAFCDPFPFSPVTPICLFHRCRHMTDMTSAVVPLWGPPRPSSVRPSLLTSHCAVDFSTVLMPTPRCHTYFTTQSRGEGAGLHMRNMWDGIHDSASAVRDFAQSLYIHGTHVPRGSGDGAISVSCWAHGAGGPAAPFAAASIVVTTPGYLNVPHMKAPTLPCPVLWHVPLASHGSNPQTPCVIGGFLCPSSHLVPI